MKNAMDKQLKNNPENEQHPRDYLNKYRTLLESLSQKTKSSRLESID